MELSCRNMSRWSAYNIIYILNAFIWYIKRKYWKIILNCTFHYMCINFIWWWVWKNQSYGVIAYFTASSTPYTVKFTAMTPTAVPLGFDWSERSLLIVRRLGTGRRKIINFTLIMKCGNIYSLLAQKRSLSIVLTKNTHQYIILSAGLNVSLTVHHELPIC